MTRGEPIVGIDLGTTFSLVAYVDEHGPQVVRDDRGEARLPSVIGFSPDGSSLRIGWEARDHAVENPTYTVYSIKRLMGRSAAEVQAELPHLAYAVQAGPRETVQVAVGGRLYAPEAISALVLRELKLRAERAMGRDVRRAVITVPAYFDDAQRQATRDAGAAAGLEVVRIINEPTAAALAYGIGLREQGTGRREPEGTKGRRDEASDDRRAIQNPKSTVQNVETVVVYDLGGGTFDVSVLRMEGDVCQVLATAGDTHLGGDDFDRTIIALVQREAGEQLGLAIDTPATRQALRLLAERVKTRLSEQDSAVIELDLGGGRVYRRTLTRDEFEALAAPLVERTIELCRRALRDAGLAAAELSQVVLVGGSTRMPLVRRRVQEEFARPAYTALNPDEVVAIGAAIQGSILAGDRLDMLLLDVTPLSLGIETMGGAMGKLILRNTAIPCRATEQFTTFVDGQTAIKINVLQGERELAADCRSLGEFELRGIPPMPAGIPKVEVEFLIDANGILNVSARELRSGTAASIQVVPNRGLTRDEAEQMARKAILHGRDDIDAHRRIDLLNQVAFDTAKTEQVLARVGRLLDRAERERIEASIRELRALAASPVELDRLHGALRAFGRGTQRLAEIGIAEALRD